MKTIRENTTQIAIYLTAIMLIILVSVIILLYININNIDNIKNLTNNHSPFTIVYLILAKTLVSFISGLILSNFFKKFTSPEIFFFSLAIFALSFTSLRSLLFIDKVLGYPAYLSETVTRFVYFGKIITILCLFTAGLFSTGIAFQKQETFLFLIIIISFILSSSIPIDLFETNIILLKGTGSEYGINIIFILLQIFAFLNFIVGSIKNNNNDYLFLALAIIMVAVSNEILFYLIPGWLSYSAITVMAGGIIVFAYKINKIYQWT